MCYAPFCRAVKTEQVAFYCFWISCFFPAEMAKENRAAVISLWKAGKKAGVILNIIKMPLRTVQKSSLCSVITIVKMIVSCFQKEQVSMNFQCSFWFRRLQSQRSLPEVTFRLRLWRGLASLLTGKRRSSLSKGSQDQRCCLTRTHSQRCLGSVGETAF